MTDMSAYVFAKNRRKELIILTIFTFTELEAAP
ncbi:hypothetical protein L1283_001645 [Sphingobacterium sp. HSC-15S19]